MLGHEPFEFLLLPLAAWHVGHDLFLSTPPDILPDPFLQNWEAVLAAPLLRTGESGFATGRPSSEGLRSYVGKERMTSKGNERKACDAVLRLLEQRSGRRRGDMRYPEEDGRGPPVDLRVRLGREESQPLYDRYADPLASE